MTDNDTSTAMVLAHEIPAPLVVFDAKTAAEAKAIVAQCNAITTIDDATRARADAAMRTGTALERQIEKHRVAAKAEPLDLCRKIDAACKGYMDQLATATKRVAMLLDADTQRQLAIVRAREEAQQRAIEEARRQAQIQEVADQVAIADLGEPATAADKVALAELEAEVMVERELSAVVPMTVPASVPKTGATRRMVDELVIDDVDAIPRTINGIELLVVDKAAVKRMLLAGVKVPGCRLTKVPQVARKGW